MRAASRSPRLELALAVSLTCLGAAGAEPSRPGPEVRFSDDLGAPITAPLEVCVTTGLERSCRPHEAAASSAQVPAELDAITVEGPEHGPITVRRRELSRQAGGMVRVTVPRKARLRVRRLPSVPVSLSLYRQDDPAFRRPTLRITGIEAEDVRVPAGDFVLSLSGRGFAPDLHLISLEPGEARAIDFHARTGWSLVLRAVASETREPLGGAAVEVAAVPGYGDPRARPSAAETDRSGIALLSGLTVPIATATLRRQGWIERREPGLSASPGTFAFREVPVERGGSLRAVITLDGEPAAGAACRLRSYSAPTTRDGDPWVIAAEATADRDGVCRMRGLVPGGYSLSVRPAKGGDTERSSALEPVRVESGRETALELHLRPIVLSGTVLRGRAPAPEHQIKVAAFGNHAMAIEEVARTTTGEDGTYEVLLWEPGELVVTARSPAGVVADAELVSITGERATCDFNLAKEDVRGLVADESGRPVAGAAVAVRWSGRLFLLAAGDDGSFSFPVEAGGGIAELTADKEGYRRSEPVKVEVPEDVAPAPAMLVLRKSDDLAGVLVSAAGTPIAGAWVAAYDVAVDGMPWQLGAATTDAAGRFTVPRTKNGAARLFATGPGCPLAATDLRPGDAPLTVTCAEAPANLEVTLKDAEGAPVPQETVALKRGAVVFPREAVATHLARLGLPAATDGAGRLVVPALAPGDYDLYLGSGANPMTMAAGLPVGHLTAAALTPLTTAELEVTVRPAGESPALEP